MKIIGITGGVGAGKSEILHYLHETYGAKIVLADRVANAIKEPGGCCYDAVVELLGRSILLEDGSINRKKMGQIIFSDEVLLAKVNAILHPAVKRCIVEMIAQERERGTALFIIEAALLLEDNYDAICDEVWYIDTAEEIRRERLKSSRGYSDEYITDIIKKQLTADVFRSRSTYVIDNSGTPEETKEQIDCILRK